MGKPKIDRVKLSQMLRGGKSQKDIAESMGVSEAAISKAKKELNINVVKSVSLENAHRVVDKSLNAVEQLQKINDQANKVIDDLSKSSDRADRELILKACREVRNQLDLQLQIFTALYDLRAVAEFQTEVLQIIGEVDPNARRQIIHRLQEKSALRRAVSFS